MNRSNEPMFPFDQNDQCGNPVHRFSGITIREHFAALAMQAMLSKDRHHSQPSTIPADAVTFADALISELGKER